jgi:hypothetical protein
MFQALQRLHVVRCPRLLVTSCRLPVARVLTRSDVTYGIQRALCLVRAARGGSTSLTNRAGQGVTNFYTDDTPGIKISPVSLAGFFPLAERFLRPL